MEVLHIKKKGQLLNTLERFQTYDLIWQKLQMNVRDKQNPIFERIIKYSDHNNAHSENLLLRHTHTTPPALHNHNPGRSRDLSYIPTIV
jgi:hypothetical protein